MSKPDGGPAYPSAHRMVQTGIDTFEPAGNGGMSLRDYFAGQYLNGLTPWHFDQDDVLPAGFAEHASHVAKSAYAMADAMLKARGE